MFILDGSGTDSKMRRASVKIINKNKVVNALKSKAKKGKVIYNIHLVASCIFHQGNIYFWIVNYSLIGRDLDDEDSEDDDESSEEEMPKSKVSQNITKL